MNESAGDTHIITTGTKRTVSEFRKPVVMDVALAIFYLDLDKCVFAILRITPTMIGDFLLEQRLSNSCRNTIIYTLKLVMREARRSGIIEMVTEFEPFKRKGKRQDTLMLGFTVQSGI